jgi:predicted glycosyltransferase
LLVLLSGPEPQRTLLENILTREIAHYSGTTTVLRGLPGHDKLIPSTNMIRFYNHLPADQLEHEILNAEFVIARSGYSTLMDMARMGKKCIFIPTPGQSEQEYLAAYWQQKQFAFGLPQKDFNLQKALEQARSFSYKEPVLPANNRLGEIIDHFLHSLSSR